MRLEAAAPRRESGRVTEVTGLVIRASVPGVRIGEAALVLGPRFGREDAAIEIFRAAEKFIKYSR